MGLIMTNTNLLPSLIHRIILKIDQHLPKIQTVSQYGDIFLTQSGQLSIFCIAVYAYETV